MRNEHIISLIEKAPVASLSESDLAAIRDHTDHCSDCRDAFQAAQVSAALLKERAVAAFEPSPFFQTRVMATLRERQAAGSWSWSRLWRSAGALASSMVATVAALAVLTFATPGTQVAYGPQQASYPNGYSAEEVILDQTSQLEEESDGQLLTTIYGGEEEASR
jgi:predicted anti-sigma-YlaC factor YlaD